MTGDKWENSVSVCSSLVTCHLSLLVHEEPSGRRHFYLRHGDPRHIGDGFNHPGPAETDSRFSWRQNDRRVELERLVRARFRAGAIRFFTGTRRFVRSLRPATGDPVVESRSRPGLRSDGAGADDRLVISRPNYFRHHHFKYSNRDGVYRRRHAERKTGRRFRRDRDRIRAWVRVWAGRRRFA